MSETNDDDDDEKINIVLTAIKRNRKRERRTCSIAYGRVQRYVMDRLEQESGVKAQAQLIYGGREYSG